MKILLIATISLPLLTCFALAQTTGSDSGSLNQTTPIALTPKWSDERDLTLLFENSNDRIALARLIISECINNASLTDLARIDGFRIAGHICYRDGAPEDATLAFTELNEFTTIPR